MIRGDHANALVFEAQPLVCPEIIDVSLYQRGLIYVEERRRVCFSHILPHYSVEDNRESGRDELIGTQKTVRNPLITGWFKLAFVESFIGIIQNRFMTSPVFDEFDDTGNNICIQRRPKEVIYLIPELFVTS